MVDLAKDFQKEKPQAKFVLGSAAVAFISTFLPWYSVEFGVGGISYSGWHSWGLLTALASLIILALWALPKFKIAIPKEIKNIKSLDKILPLVVLAGPVLWLVLSGFNFRFLGLGFYLAVIAGIVAVVYTFKK